MASSDPRARLEAAIQADPKKALAEIQRINKYVIKPHEGGQMDVDRSDVRFQVVCAGRRWGKTKIAVRKALRECRKDDKIVWWVAPTYKVVRRAYRETLKQIPPGLLSKAAPPATADGRLILHFKTGSRMEFYSADNPESMIGEGVDYVVVDEAAVIAERTWYQIIRPTLMDSHGSALLISTPRGHNWFYDVWTRGQDELIEDYASWRFPTASSPYIPESEIREAEETLPRVIFEQEILADFVSNAAAVFRLKEDSIQELVEPEGHVVMGVDLAKHHDFTVLTASRSSDYLPCYHDRFNTVSWPEQKQRILSAITILEEKGCEVTVGIDATGIGDVIFDDLEAEGVDVVPIKFTNQWKQQAVTLLGADIEQGHAFILEEQKAEFMGYSYEISEATGRFKFSAPPGRHDDEVSAKLLEHWVHAHGGIPAVNLLDFADGDAENQAEEEAEQQSAAYVEQKIEATEPASPQELLLRDDVWS